MLGQVPALLTAACDEWGQSSAPSPRSRPVLTPAGLFALLGLSVYTGVTVNFFGKRYADWRFSWSYILGWIAVILTLSAGTCSWELPICSPLCVQAPGCPARHPIPLSILWILVPRLPRPAPALGSPPTPS